jgi:hypothetical protein
MRVVTRIIRRAVSPRLVVSGAMAASFLPPPHASAQTGCSAEPLALQMLVLSHFIEAPASVATAEWFSLFDLEQAVAEVGRHYAGPVETAADLQCIPLR